jgi:hypothetical protein
MRGWAPLVLALVMTGGAACAAEPATGEGMPSDVRGSYACALLGGAASATTFALGAENLVNVVAGGIVAPANPGILVLGVAGVVFATFCTVGQSLAPAAADLGERLSGPASFLGNEIATLAQRAGGSLGPPLAEAAGQAMQAAERVLEEGSQAAGLACAWAAPCAWLFGLAGAPTAPAATPAPEPTPGDAEPLLLAAQRPLP